MVKQPTKEDPCDECVCIVAGIVSLRDVAHAEQVKLDLPPASGDVDGKEDGPSDAAADETNRGCNLQVSEQQIAIE